ncbi:MAG: transglycosylase SLT domain-containing protein [Deltaproteobacteria bacterium]|nr:transglycosylase SLT domain-containing protein [Deltaproteobacteria bacterium]
MKKLIVIFILLIMPLQVNAYEGFNRIIKYDRYFSKYSKRYFGPGFDWRFFKAQAIAESRLKANAKSRVGALGIMQIMPRTFKDIARKNPMVKGRVIRPRWNIAAGICYNRVLWKEWKAERPFQDRLNFMFGSYNAGKSNIIKAQRIAMEQHLNENLWKSIEQVLPKVTGKSSGETVGYVRKINKIKEVLK